MSSRPAVEVRLPQPEDIDLLVANMRPQDVAELRATGLTDTRAAVADSVRVSWLCWTALVDGELACIFGVAAYGVVTNGVGVPWMLGTPVVPRHRRVLADLAPFYIRRMRRVFPHLVNQVHARNTVAVRWLRHVGFTLHEPHPVMPTGEMFHTFEMKD